MLAAMHLGLESKLIMKTPVLKTGVFLRLTAVRVGKLEPIKALTELDGKEIVEFYSELRLGKPNWLNT